LRAVEDWNANKENIIATIDAGPNVHLLIPESEKDAWVKKLESLKKSTHSSFEWMVSRASN
jgi:mevalonate pyrophosphate decarboxylase